jgi:hypothetical protein
MSELDLRSYDGKVRTFDGHEAVIMCTNLVGDHPVLVKYRDQNYEWRSLQVRSDGTFKKNKPFIVPVPPLKEEFASGGWSNLRTDKAGRARLGSLYPTKEAAEARVTGNTVRTCRVTFVD